MYSGIVSRELSTISVLLWIQTLSQEHLLWNNSTVMTTFFFNRGPLGQTQNKERSLEAVNSITLDHFWTSLYKHSSEIEASCIFNKFNLRGTERVCERGWSHREREAYATKERNIRLGIDRLRGQNAHPAHHHPLLKPQGCFKTAPYTA